jgi:heme-degrading monooxygenase HmoA
MILETAVLNVRPGHHDRFEQAFLQAKDIIARARGFVDLQLHRCVETPGRYLLLVHWNELEDHTEGFRGSPAYQDWKSMLHHFYEPFPDVEHYELAVEVPTAPS